jgi:hypothetical protein
MDRRSLLAALFVVVVAGAAPVALSDEPKLKVEARGPDGKPVSGGKMMVFPFDSLSPYRPNEKLQPGELVVVSVVDNKGNGASKVVEVPRTGSLVVPMDLAPASQTTLFFDSYANAKKASEAGDFDGFTKHALDAKEDIDRKSERLEADEKAVDAWAEHNDLPILSLGELDASLERAEKNGLTPKNSTAIRRLEQYRSYREALEARRALIQFDLNQLQQLKTPERRTSLAPATCPNGEGGLLAGFINSVTGSDLAAACDIDATRDKNRDRRDPKGDRDHHGHD